MNKRTPLTELDSNLNRTTWPPLLLLATFFLIAMGYTLYDQRQRSWIHFEHDLTEMIDFQERSFADEIYLNQTEALNARMETIVRNWRRRSPVIHACIRVVPFDSNSNGKMFTQCTSEQDGWDEGQGRSLEKEVRVGNTPIARIQYFVAHDTDWDDIFPPRLLFAILFAAILALVLHRYLVKNLNKNILAPLLQRVAQDERNAVIAQTTQMLAHDVKKPLLLLKYGLHALKTTTDASEFKERSIRIVSEVDAALLTVDGMLSDILDAGAPIGPGIEEVSLRALLKPTLTNVFRIYRDAKVTLRYEFKHIHLLVADPKKISRVLTNLTENAVQAMNESGQLWFKTREFTEAGANLVEICIGNSGSVISEEDLQRIFDPFYTTKKKGTGLGLAVAKRIVDGHGGNIRCTSSAETGTQFFIVLPAGTSTEKGEIELPIHSGQARLRTVIEAKEPETRGQASRNEKERQTILLFDDERLVHDVWSQRSEGEKSFNLMHFMSWEEFVGLNGDMLVQGSIAFVDLNFKNSKFDGLDIAKNLRSLGIRKIYAITGDVARASESGLFDAVLGKDMPMDLKGLIS